MRISGNTLHSSFPQSNLPHVTQLQHPSSPPTHVQSIPCKPSGELFQLRLGAYLPTPFLRFKDGPGIRYPPRPGVHQLPYLEYVAAETPSTRQPARSLSCYPPTIRGAIVTYGASRSHSLNIARAHFHPHNTSSTPRLRHLRRNLWVAWPSQATSRSRLTGLTS
jgi:hypothetical protein